MRTHRNEAYADRRCPVSRKSNSTIDIPIADRLDAAPEGKSIRYDRITGDYAMFLDRVYLDHAESYSEAEAKISAVYYDRLIHTAVETADLDADACLPFEPTQAELEAYAEDWDEAVADEQAALKMYAAEWDAAVQLTLDTITVRWKADVEMGATLPAVTAELRIPIAGDEDMKS